MFTWRWRGGWGGIAERCRGRRGSTTVAISPEQGLERPRRNSIERLNALPAVVFIQVCLFSCIDLFLFSFHGVRMPFLSHVSRVVCAVPWCECGRYCGRCFSAPLQVSSCMGRVCAWVCVHICVCTWLFSFRHCKDKGPECGFYFFGIRLKGWINFFCFFSSSFFGGLTFLWTMLAFQTGPVFVHRFECAFARAAAPAPHVQPVRFSCWPHCPNTPQAGTSRLRAADILKDVSGDDSPVDLCFKVANWLRDAVTSFLKLPLDHFRLQSW